MSVLLLICGLYSFRCFTNREPSGNLIGVHLQFGNLAIWDMMFGSSHNRGWADARCVGPMV